MQIWDTAGEERFRNVVSSYYRGASGIVLVYNINDRNSFKSLNSYLEDIEKNAKENINKILVGNNCEKEDCENEELEKENERELSFEEGKNFAEKNGMKFLEISPKSYDNIKEVFDLLVADMIKTSEEEKNKKKLMILI